MTRLRRSSHRCTNRKGFTLIELLVVISIIALIASLLAPAIQSARRSARRVQCLSNMRNVGLAMQNFASNNNGRLPSLVSYPYITNASQNQGYLTMPWSVQLLPFRDNAALFKNIRNDAQISGGIATIYLGAGTSGSSSTTSDGVAIEVYGCPDSSSAYKKKGGLSYVVNAGHMPSTIWGNTSSTFYNYPYSISWTGTNTVASDTPIGLSTGVFWPSQDAVVNPQNRFSSSMDFVLTGDGSSSTIMLSENLQAGTWYGTVSSSSTTSAGVNGVGFGISYVTSSLASYYPNSGTGGNGNGDDDDDDDDKHDDSVMGAAAISAPTSNAPAQTTPTQLFISQAATPDTYFINRNLSANSGTAPRPSSNHARGVNTIMCDGSGRFLTETVDHIVYTKLMTSNGVSYGEQALNQGSY